MVIIRLHMEISEAAQQTFLQIHMVIQQAHMEILVAQEFLVILSPMAIAQLQVGLLTKYVG